MASEWLIGILDAIALNLGQRRDELDKLDEAVGDGRLGGDLLSCIEAIEAEAADIGSLPPPTAIRRMAALLRENTTTEAPRFLAVVLDGMAEPAGDDRPVPSGVALMLESGVRALERTGEVELGMKSMYDVLQPLSKGLSAAVQGGHDDGLDNLAISICAHTMHRTRDMPARRRNMDFADDAGLGHMDPGACAVALIVGAIVGEVARFNEA